MRVVLLLVCMAFIISPARANTLTSPFAEFIGDELVEQFRISKQEVAKYGNINAYLWQESDAMTLTRVAIGEAPNSLDDRIFIMWNIRLRSELGYKNAKRSRGSEIRWGAMTSIKIEALCYKGCQFQPVKVLEDIRRPDLMSGHQLLRNMVYPDDDYLGEFYLTYILAQEILDLPIDSFPVALRGYESFRSPSIAVSGYRNREGGLRAVQFFVGGNIWRDQYPQDNAFWDKLYEEPICATLFCE